LKTARTKHAERTLRVLNVTKLKIV